MSRMHNPAHPGEVLKEWLPEQMTVTQAAKELQVSCVTLYKVLKGKEKLPKPDIKPLERLTA